jgi:hypothetical protein
MSIPRVGKTKVRTAKTVRPASQVASPTRKKTKKPSEASRDAPATRYVTQSQTCEGAVAHRPLIVP